MKGEGKKWSPAVIPFHKPELITRPELRGWWNPGSIESWYQSAKYLEAEHDPLPAADIYFVTSNNGKVESARHSLQKNIHKVTLDISEEQDSVAEIAKHKAKVAYAVVCKPVMTDDSGFEIPALNCWPGHHVKRELEKQGIEKFVSIAKEHGGSVDAAFVQTVAYMDENHASPKLFTSRTDGKLIAERRGEWRPYIKSELGFYFVPKNQDLTVAEMDDAAYKIHASTDRWGELAKYLEESDGNR